MFGILFRDQCYILTNQISIKCTVKCQSCQTIRYIKRNIQYDYGDHCHRKNNLNCKDSFSLDHALTNINHKNAL